MPAEPPLTHASDAQLAAAVEANFHSWFRSMVRALSGEMGLQGLGTLQAYRGKGIGSAMQLERLRLAREMGYRYAVLAARKMGQSPYLKLGFRDTGRRISRYIWRIG